MNVPWMLALAACFSDPPDAVGEFSCEAFAEPDDCLQQAATLVGQTCLVPAGEVGELDATRTECTFSDGTLVTFAPPLTDTVDPGAPLEMWIDYLEPPRTEDGEPIPQVCHVYTLGDDYPREVGYEVYDDLTDTSETVDARWYQDSEEFGISISCNPQSVTVVDAESLLTCDDFPVTPFRVTNASRDGRTVRSVSVIGTTLNVACALPD